MTGLNIANPTREKNLADPSRQLDDRGARDFLPRVAKKRSVFQSVGHSSIPDREDQPQKRAPMPLSHTRAARTCRRLCAAARHLEVGQNAVRSADS